VDIPTITLNNNAVIPQIGLGVWRASDEEAERAVLMAIDAGYRLIDTATVYQNERGVGRAIAATPVPREELFITTKLWNSDQGYDQTLRAFDASLERLGIDYVDLYLIHWQMPKVGLYNETWRAFEKLYADGKIRAIGVSNFDETHLTDLMENGSVIPAVNQIEVHPDFQQKQLRDFCAKHDIAVESWSPLGGSRSGNAVLQTDIIKSIATKHGKTPAQIALRWHIENNLIVIPKSVHEKRIKENIALFDFTLDPDDHAQIATLDGDNRQGADPATMNNY